MALQFSRKIKKEFGNGKVSVKREGFKLDIDSLVDNREGGGGQEKNKYHFLFPYVFLFLSFISIFFALIDLQVLNSDKYVKRAKANQFEVEEIKPNRGIILDRNGKALAVNVPAVSVYFSSEIFFDDAKLKGVSKKVEDVIGDVWKKSPQSQSFPTLHDKALAVWGDMKEEDRNWVRRVEVLSGLSNDIAVTIKSQGEKLAGVTVEDGSKRKYPFGESSALLIGYTGDVFAEDLEQVPYITFNDVIGKTGIEKIYDEELFGIKGKLARERDSMGQIVQGGYTNVTPAVSGSTITLSIDASAQKKMYEILRKGVQKYGASGGAGILEDVRTGEILVLASYPSFDNNKFVDGISQKEYDSLIGKYKNPLLNRAIAAEVPPGSTFKTLVAASALNSGVINRNTVYVSRRGYTFSDGKPFQEYRNNAYGALDLVSAISVSSNIYFCEVIRNWNMDKLVPYLEKFGIGQRTNIDLLGEGTGRLPSSENKIALAKTTSPWLDPVWYPEGDSCNSVIGQGITTVTPIQMVNWVSAIANGGTLLHPHLATKIEKVDGETEVFKWPPLRTSVAKDWALSIVREGMWASVNGPRRVIAPLTDAKVEVAGKTGTAEFGALNSKGEYTHTHAWVTGFFPYEKPKYAFVVFLEDGGESNNSAQLAREFIDWFVTK